MIMKKCSAVRACGRDIARTLSNDAVLVAWGFQYLGITDRQLL